MIIKMDKNVEFILTGTICPNFASIPSVSSLPLSACRHAVKNENLANQE